MDLELGKHYRIIMENGSEIAGELTEVKWLRSGIYSLCIDIGRQPVYIAYRDVKEFVQIDNYENESR